MHSIWQESLHALFQAIAELGGLELTTFLMLALFIYLWRGGFGADALVVVAFAGAVGLELVYKNLFFHPGPPRSLSHADGPSLTEVFSAAGWATAFRAATWCARSSLTACSLLSSAAWRHHVSCACWRFRSRS